MLILAPYIYMNIYVGVYGRVVGAVYNESTFLYIQS